MIKQIMKKTVLKVFFSLMLAMLLGSLFVHQASALSLGVGPSYLNIKHAVPGESYLKTIWVYNTSTEDGQYSLSATGDIASWATFSAFDNQDQVINEIAVSANGSSYAYVKFSIPEDASPLVYQGQLVVTTKNANSEETGAGAQVQMQMPILVTIEMEGAPDVIPEPLQPAPTYDANYKPGQLNYMSLSYEGQPMVGHVFKLQATVYNPTKDEISAILIAEVYQGDKLIDISKSDPFQIPQFSTEKTLTAYYTPTQSGDLTISAYVYYGDGRTTEKKDIKIQVAEAGGTPVMTIIGAIFGAVVIAAAVPLYIKRRNGKNGKNGKHHFLAGK